MTTLLENFALSPVGRGLFDITMSDQQSDQNWQHNRRQQQQQNQQHHAYYAGMPLLTDQWTVPTTQAPNAQQPQQSVYGMTAVNRSMYTNENYMPYTTTVSNTNTLLSPGSVYTPTDSNWPSDMDVTTTPNFPSAEDPLVPYPQSHLALPARDPRPSKHAHPSVSPQQQPGEPMSLDPARPPLGPRAKTAPVKGQRANKATASNVLSEDSDEDLVPDELPDPTKATTTKGRKRQRIPHTAVERRYRENLNAHLERLRQTVPSLASRRPPGNAGTRGSDAGVSDGAKPSKCEILNGAIEHIGSLDRENVALKSECSELRARVDDLQRWYSAALRSGGHYPE